MQSNAAVHATPTIQTMTADSQSTSGVNRNSYAAVLGSKLPGPVVNTGSHVGVAGRSISLQLADVQHTTEANVHATPRGRHSAPGNGDDQEAGTRSNTVKNTPRGREDTHGIPKHDRSKWNALNAEIATLRKQLEKTELKLKAAQQSAAQAENSHWDAIRMCNELEQDMQPVKQAGKQSSATLSALRLAALQLSTSMEEQAEVTEASLVAVHSAMREYHEVLMSADGASSEPGTPTPSRSMTGLPLNPSTPKTGDSSPELAGMRHSPSSRTHYLQQQIELRDHIITNLAGHLGKLERVMKQGSGHTMALTKKIVMLSGTSMES